LAVYRRRPKSECAWVEDKPGAIAFVSFAHSGRATGCLGALNDLEINRKLLPNLDLPSPNRVRPEK